MLVSGMSSMYLAANRLAFGEKSAAKKKAIGATLTTEAEKKLKDFETKDKRRKTAQALNAITKGTKPILEA